LSKDFEPTIGEHPALGGHSRIHKLAPASRRLSIGRQGAGIIILHICRRLGELCDKTAFVRIDFRRKKKKRSDPEIPRISC
jgi:hypothetical protein